MKGAVKTKVQQPLFQQSKRQFSGKVGGSSSAGSMIGFGLAGASILGLTYLSYMGHQQFTKTPPQQRMHLFNPVVQQRIRSTFGYFSLACTGTAGFMFLFRNNMRLLNMGMPMSILFFVGSLGLMIGTQFTDYHQNWALKNLLYTGFVASMSVSLLPIIHMYSMPVIYDAIMATGVTVGALSAVAYNAPSE